MSNISDSEEYKSLRRELNSVRDEYKRFTRMVSHDLSAPFRQISAFAEMIKGASPEDAKADEYLGHILSAAIKGQRTIEALRKYQRVDEEFDLQKNVSLKACWKSAVKKLEKRKDSVGIHIEVSELPEWTCDGEMMQFVFSELLNNALVFKQSEALQVKMQHEIQENRLILHFEDNGMGMAEERAVNCFDMMQKLHTNILHDGVGMGLAIVQKIIHMHGGTISVKSKVGRGTAFTMSLPTL